MRPDVGWWEEEGRLGSRGSMLSRVLAMLELPIEGTGGLAKGLLPVWLLA